MVENSKFQFNGFKVVHSEFDRVENIALTNVVLSFFPEGKVYRSASVFELTLRVNIEDERTSLKINLTAKANYSFSPDIDIKNLNNLFFINAPALLFPYIRAYISTLTNLSGFEPINLPTLNMSVVGADLEKNTQYFD